MFLILLTLFFVVLSILGAFIDKSKNFKTGFCIAPIIIAIVMIMGILGAYQANLYVYEDLVKSKESVLSYGSEIQSVREAYYKESNTSNATLLNGSLDNIKQSTNLSDYICRYASAKALYNSTLKGIKIRKTLRAYYWVTFSMFIPEQVMQLEEIK
jgi:hypothetical protein